MTNIWVQLNCMEIMFLISYSRKLKSRNITIFNNNVLLILVTAIFNINIMNLLCCNILRHIIICNESGGKGSWGSKPTLPTRKSYFLIKKVEERNGENKME